MAAPRMVRNFWVHARVDGRMSLLRGGPRARDGGLMMILYQRREGRVAVALRIFCTACRDGTLRVEVDPALPTSPDRRRTILIETKR